MMIPWGLVEQKQGEYDWSQTDPVIRELTAARDQALPVPLRQPALGVRAGRLALLRQRVRRLPAALDRDQGRVRGLRRGRRRALRARGRVLAAPLSSSPRDGTPRTTRATRRLPAPGPLPAAAAPAAAAGPTAAPGEPPCGLHQAAPDHHLADLERAELAQVLRPEAEDRPLRRHPQARRQRHPRRRPGSRRRRRRDVGPGHRQGGGHAGEAVSEGALRRQRDRAELRLDRDPPLRRRRPGLDRPARDRRDARSSRPAIRASASG